MLGKLKFMVVYLSLLTFAMSSSLYSATKMVYISPLITAVKNRDLAKTKYYIKSGYAINITDNLGNTPLTYAIRNEDYDIMLTLLESGADPEIKDSTEYPIYCTAKVSGSNRIRLFFEDYTVENCPDSVKMKRPDGTSARRLSSINWSAIGGGILAVGAVGGIAAAAGGGSGGSSDGNSGDSTLLTPDQIVIYENIINGRNTDNAKYYSGYTFSEGGYSNVSSYNNINLAYAWARGFDGSVNQNSSLTSSSGQPQFLSNSSISSSAYQIGDSINIAVLDSGVYSGNQFVKNNLQSASGTLDSNQLYQFYKDSCTGSSPCFVHQKDATTLIGIKCTGSNTLSCSLYKTSDYGATSTEISGTTFSISSNDTNPLNSDSQHGTNVASLIIANPVETTSDTYIGFSGIAPNANVIPYLITANYSYQEGSSSYQFGSFADFKHIGNAIKSASENNAVAINNSWGTVGNWGDGGLLKISNDDIIINYPLLGINNLTLNENILYYLYNDTATSSSYNSSIDYSSSIYKSTFLDGMIDAVNLKDSIFVFSAGNNSQIGPFLENLIPLYLKNDNDTLTFFDEATNYYKNFITVVAFDDSTGRLADYSNKCGVAKNYCLTAPGTNLMVANGTGISVGSGTSFSAPIVSGAIAILKGAFPYLTGAEITRILFVTATDLGAAGVDEVYGWGLLNLEKATRPVGITTIPTGTSLSSLSSFGSFDSKIKLSSLISNSIKEKNLKLVMMDSFNRTFNVSLNDFIETEKDRINTIDILNRFGSKNETISLNKNGDFNLYYTKTEDFRKNNKNNEIEFSYSVDNINANNYGFNIYYGNNPYNAFVGDKHNFYNDFSLANAYNYNVLNPYFKSNSNKNFGFNNIFKLNDKTQFNIGIINQNYTIDYDKYYENRKKTEELGNSLSFLAGMKYDISKSFSTKIEFGLLNEYNTLFGTKWNGAFGIGDNNITYMTSLQNELNLFKNKFSIIGKINFGYTNVNSVQNSLIKNISNLYSNSYAFGLNYNFDSDFSKQKSNVSFLISQPISLQSGSLDISLPVARDADGNLYYSNHKINLNNQRETNYQFTYNHSIKNDSSFNFGAIYRDYIDDEFIVLLKYKKNFSF